MDLIGKCLIARPTITDPLFKRSVVFIYEHTPQATIGLVINKKTPTMLQLKDVLQHRGYDTVATDPLYIGGPVNERAICLLHTTGWHSSNTMVINDRFSISSDDLMIYKYCNGDVPSGFKFCMGTAVWHPQQIVMELKANHWLVSDLSTHNVFDYEGRELWDLAIENNAKETIDKFF
jgi:putative transcriptional regulator